MTSESATSRENQRKVLVGVVTSAKMDKTRRVEVPRRIKHPKYGKYLNRKTVCYVHDEENASNVGDQVEIMETRPLSKTKRWRLVRIVLGAARGVAETVASDEVPAGDAAV